MERVHSLSADAYNPYFAWVSSNAAGLVLATGVGVTLAFRGKGTGGMLAKASFFALAAGGAFMEFAGVTGAREAHVEAAKRYSNLRQRLEVSIQCHIPRLAR